MGYILSIDQGTTGTTALLINDQTFELVGKENTEFPQIYPQPGWVEHNLEDIWESLQDSIIKVLKTARVQKSEITSIGITNQRETTCAFYPDGTPACNAIVWQDRRTESFCKELIEKNLTEVFKKKTGLPLDPYFSGTKMRWILENIKDLKKDSLKLGTIDTYLLYKLTSGESFFTEASNASRTLLMDIEKGGWDDELLGAMGVDKKFLPEIKDSFYNFGKTKGLDFLPDGIPITGILGDQQAALFGQACFEKGQSKCTYGTGAFMLLNTGSELTYSDRGLLSTIAYQKDGQRVFALEGSCYIAGAAVQWLRDNLNFFEQSPDVEKEAKKINDLKQVYNILFFPFFTGMGSPYWKSDAKASIIGLTRDSGVAHLSWACLEGIALSIHDLIESFESDSGVKLNDLKVDGGAANNSLMMEMQATISELDVIRPEVIETTGYGAALASAVGLGKVSFDEIKELWREKDRLTKNVERKSYSEHKKSLWKGTVHKLYLS